MDVSRKCNGTKWCSGLLIYYPVKSVDTQYQASELGLHSCQSNFRCCTVYNYICIHMQILYITAISFFPFIYEYVTHFKEGYPKLVLELRPDGHRTASVKFGICSM